MKSSLHTFRIIAFLEGISYLLLIGIAMPLKYMYAMPMPNKIIGMAHGVLFVAYVFFLMQVHNEQKWGWKNTILAFLASMLPFTTFILDAKLLKPLEQKNKN